MSDLIFKLVTGDEWARAEAVGVLHGSAVDHRDGFIHFSTADQVRETAARHFAGVQDLLLVAVDPTGLPIRWEPSRGGALFPHLYEPLRLTSVQWKARLDLGPDGHTFPSMIDD